MSHAKQVIYRYDAIEAESEFIHDLNGQIPTPAKGEIISRKGRQWKVVHVVTKTSTDPKGPIPVVTINTTSNLNLPVYP
jgi:hypothetical protein